MKSAPPKSKERAILGLVARMKELGVIKKAVHAGIKAESIRISLEVYKKND